MAPRALFSAALALLIAACGGADSGKHQDNASVASAGDEHAAHDPASGAPDTSHVHHTAEQSGAAAGAAHAHGAHIMPGVPDPVIPPGVLYTAADVHFMQGMIAHHAQAIVMTRLAETRSSAQDLLRFAQKIDISQTDEILFMQTWLRENKQYVPDTSSHATFIMPGMLSKEQLSQLEKAKGVEFDRLFLTFMIQHHEGALKMVEELRASPGAAQDSDIFHFSSEVDADQRAEIYRMHYMLENLQGGSQR